MTQNNPASTPNGPSRKAKVTVRDVAKAAGVSLATVDRVLNKRKGVRKATIAKVEKAVQELGYARDLSASLLARAKSGNLTFILPQTDNPFMQGLRAKVQERAAQLANTRTQITILDVPALDGPSIAQNLDACDPETTDCAILIACDDVELRRAVARATTKGISVLTLVSDLPESRRNAFIGVDNVAAGRTAASLMGRFLRRGERVGLIVGSLGLHDHRDRFIGFSDLMLEQFPEIELVGPVEGFDNVAETERKAMELLQSMPRLDGIYSLGAGNEGLFAALRASLGPGRIRVIVHELDQWSRQALQEGYCDIVLDQSAAREVETAIELAMNLVVDPELQPNVPASEISLHVQENLISSNN